MHNFESVRAKSIFSDITQHNKKLSMKKSKSEPSIKKKQKNTSLKLKKKRKTSSQAERSSKIIKKEQIPRKSRWEEATKVVQDLKKTETSVLPMKTEKEDVVTESSPRIKSLLEDKKKMVEQLFVTVTGKTLDDLIPDYLRKRPIDELKKLCLVELEKMSNEEILNIISGKGPPLFKEQETQTELCENSNNTVAPVDEDLKMEKENEQLENIAYKSEIKECDAQNQTLPEVLDEVAKDLGTSEGDADLLELEMRARAIRSLLKLKSDEEFDLDSNLLEDE